MFMWGGVIEKTSGDVKVRVMRRKQDLNKLWRSQEHGFL